MRAELKLIIASAPINATEADLNLTDMLICEIFNWEYFADKLITNCSAGLFYRKFALLKNKNLIPAETQKLIKKAYQTTFIHNTRIYTEFIHLCSVLQEHSIPFITLKGICICEWLYRDAGLRQMSDIDILIQEKDGVRCLDALHKAGYAYQHKLDEDIFCGKSHNHYNPLFRNGVMVEIHIRLQNTSEIYQQNLKEVWQNAMPVKLNGIETLRLELSDMLIHACLHLDKHFVTTHVQFTSFNDIANLLRMITPHPQPLSLWRGEQEEKKENGERTKSQEPKIKNEEVEGFWEHFETKCIKYKFADTVFIYLVLAKKYYKAPLPQYLADKYSSLLTEEVKNRFENFLAGENNAFIGRDAPRSNTEAHMRHLKQLKNPVDFMRYLRGVVFPPKTFMVEKYNPQPLPIKESGQVAGSKSKKGSPLGVRGRLWWLWYGYRWLMGLRGLWLVLKTGVRGKR